MKFERFCEIFLHLFFPVNCPVCGKSGKIFCDGCVKELFNDKVITKNLEYLTINSASWYHTRINELISAFKYSGVKSLCKPFGRSMAKFFNKPENTDYLVPVPLHLKSRRNYNQALEIAKGLSEIWGIKILECSKWSYIMPARAGMNLTERKKLKSDAFTITKEISNYNIAIIDDVCTTGLTLLRFSEVLKNHGANIICAYTLATVRGE